LGCRRRWIHDARQWLVAVVVESAGVPVEKVVPEAEIIYDPGIQ
jgi:hypothetical protein